MAQHISEIFQFVRIQKTDGTDIWWPALCSESFDTLMKNLSNRTCAFQAYCTLARRKLAKPNENYSWVVLFGQDRPTKKIFYGIKRDEINSQMKGFFDDLEGMERSYEDNSEWQTAKEEALVLLEKKMTIDHHYTIDCPDGSFTVFDPQVYSDEADTDYKKASSQNSKIPGTSERLQSNDTASHTSNAEPTSMHNNQDEDFDMCGGISDGEEEDIVPKETLENALSKKPDGEKDNTKKRKQILLSVMSINETSNAKKSRKNTEVSKEADGSNKARTSPRFRKIEVKSETHMDDNSSNQLGKRKRESNTSTSSKNISNDETKIPLRRSPRRIGNNEADSLKPEELPDTDSRKLERRLSPRHRENISSTPTKTNDQSYNNYSSMKNKPEHPVLASGGTSYAVTYEESSFKKVTPQRHSNPTKKKKDGRAMIFQKKKKRVIKGRDSWTAVMDILTLDYGFYFVPGSGLINEYWVYNEYQPDDSEVNEEYLKENLELNKQYFLGEEGLKAYVHKKYRWIGEEGREYTPLKGRRRSLKLKESKSMEKIDAKYSKSKETKPMKGDDMKDSTFKAKKRTKDIKPNEKKAKTEPLEELEKQTIRQRLMQSSKSLNECNNSKDTFYDGSELNSSFSQKKNEILRFLEDATSLNTNGLMYVCGNPGQGKTTLVKDCVDKISSSDKKIKTLEVTASSLGGENISKTLFGRVARKIGKSHNTSINSLEKLFEKNDKYHIVVILDEIQFLMKSKSIDPYLIMILDWASSKTHELTVIGISNAIADDDARLLHSKAEIGHELVFEPYSEVDLRGIALKRLGPNIELFESHAIDLACKKIAKNNGDARSLLDVLKRATVKCQKSLSKEQLSGIEVNSPVVKPFHVAQSFQQDINKTKTDIINKLPSRAKIVLCVATALDQVCEKSKSIPLSQLKRYSFEAIHQGLIDDMSSTAFQTLVETLADSGLINFVDTEHVADDFDDGEKWISVGTQLEEIEYVIKSCLLENSFYKKIVDEVKKMQLSF